MDKYVEKLNGFMEALGTMNMDTNRGSEYMVIKLQDGARILPSLAVYHASLSDKHPPEYWYPKLNETNWARFETVAAKWFFDHKVMENLPEQMKKHLLAVFQDIIKEMLGEYQVYELITTPPIWYAAIWDEFVFYSKHGIFLFHFSLYD